MLINRALQMILAMLLVSIFLSDAPGKTRKIARGIWGGEQINITVEDESATIEYSCAHGMIKGPLVLDGKGRFKLSGTHTFERGGPVRSDEVANTRPALYTGTIKGKTMRLTVKLTDTNETLGTFTLVLGKQGRIVRCL